MNYDEETWNPLVNKSQSHGVVDVESGIALDVPFGLQGPRVWWHDDPVLYNRLLARAPNSESPSMMTT